jgi:hypothetical protein
VDNEIVRIREDDPCPCGSGKRLMDCCVRKGHRCSLLEYGDKRIPFDLDETNNNVTDFLNYC